MSKFFRSLGICITSILILVIAQSLSSLFLILKLNGLEYILQGIFYILILYILTKIYITKILKKNLIFFRITNFYFSFKLFLISILLPVFVLSSLYLFVPGEFYVNKFSYTRILINLSIAIFTVGLPAGIVEEIIFRGIIMKTIENSYSRLSAILVPSLLFGILHILNGNIDLKSALLLIFGGTFAGIMFSLITICNNSIWPSAIIHSLWNIFIIGGLISFGINFDKKAIIGYKMDSNFILTGGNFGIEVSIFAILGYILVILYNLYLIKCKENLTNL